MFTVTLRLNTTTGSKIQEKLISVYTYCISYTCMYDVRELKSH